MKQETALQDMNGMESLLLSLSPECVDYETTTEDEIIKDFVNYYQKKEDIVRILAEGQQVLAMDPFPWEWVADTRGYYSCVIETRELIEDPEFYRKWLQSVLQKLEVEAKRQGKLS